MYSVISGVLTSATNSVSNNVNNVYMKFSFQQRNGENRVIISAGSSQINNCVKSLNTGVIPNCDTSIYDHKQTTGTTP